jgi:HEAT repeat protein
MEIGGEMRDNTTLGYLPVLIGTVLVLALIPLHVATGVEPIPQEIPKLVEQLASPDADLVADTINLLKSVRSKDGLTAILRSLGTVSRPVRRRLCEVLVAAGEPAVEVAFAGSVPRPGTEKARVPWANHVLTCYLKTDALPLLAMKVRQGKSEERKVAAWAIWHITNYYGVGQSDPAELVALLLAAASEDSVSYVKRYSADALCNIEHDTSIPALVKLLSDEEVSGYACSGLAQRSAKASDAIPVLKRGIGQGKLPAKALDALIAIQGKEAVPFVFEHLATWEFGPNDRNTISAALLRHPHAVAIPFMEEELWKGSTSSRVRAALFFSALDHPASFKQMRKCLSVFPEGKTERTHPLNTQVACARRLRAIAVRYLSDHGDTGSYDTILEMLKADTSIKVRTAAAQSLGKIRYEKAIPALQACFFVPDEGHNAMGHRNGATHVAAVQALANMESPEAYRVLYEGVTEGHAKKHCSRFWRNAEDRTVFETFLEHFEKAHLDDQTAAGIIAAQLRTHHAHYAIPENDLVSAKNAFVTGARDPERFGPDADLSDAGKWNVSIDFAFYKNGFVKVHFSFSPKQRRGFSHGYTMLYRKQKDSWVPMSKISRYVT